LGEVGNEEGSLYDVKRKNGLHTMYHVEGGVAGQLASGGTICPECKGYNRWPSGVVAFTCLEDGVVNHTVLLFDDAIHLGIVHRYADVSDAELVCRPVKCCNISGAIVSDDLLYCSLPAQNLFKDEGANCAASLHAQYVPLRPSCK